MPLSTYFWILMLAWLVSSLWVGWTTPPPGRYPLGVWSIVLFLLFLILGWHAFGGAVKGG